MEATTTLMELAANGTLDAASLSERLQRGELDAVTASLARELIESGPEWSEQRWPIDPSARLLPTITGDTVGLEWWVPFGEGWEIPAAFEYSGSGPFDWALWIHVIEGAAECVALKAWASDGRPMTAQGFRRLPLGRLAHQAVLLVSRPAAEIPKRNESWRSVEEAKRMRDQVSATYRRSKRSPRDRAPIDDELLEDVARVYRANLSSGAPTKAVSKELSYSRASAGRLVMEARRRGFLPPTEARKARG